MGSYRPTYRRLVGPFLGAVILGAVACEEIGWGPEEEPPSRIRELRKPDWKTKADLPPRLESPSQAPRVEATPEIVPEESPEGAFAIVLERYKNTTRANERARAVEEVVPDMTAGDVTRALEGIKSGKRLDAEVGMALITAYYTPLKEWSKILDAYKELFKNVPELRFDPRYILEHAWTLYKLGEYEKALKRTEDAELHFDNLAKGRSTLEFRARLLECRAWCYEGLYRKSIAQGGDDETVALWRSRALQAWTAYRDLLKPHENEGTRIKERLAMAEDHIAGFKSRSE